MFKKYAFGLLVLLLAGIVTTLALVTSFNSATPQIDDEPVVLDVKSTPAASPSPSDSALPADDDEAEDTGHQEVPAVEEQPEPAEEVAPAPAAVVPAPAYVEQPLPPAPAPQHYPVGDDDWDDDDWDDDDD